MSKINEIEILQSRLLENEFEYLSAFLTLHETEEGKNQLKEMVETATAENPKNIEIRNLMNDILRLDRATTEEKIEVAKKFNAMVEIEEQVKRKNQEIDKKVEDGVNFWVIGIGGGIILSCYFPPLLIVVAGAFLWKLMPSRK